MQETMDLALYSSPAKLPDISLLAGETALLVIDMQYLDAHPDWGIGRKARMLGTHDQLRYYFERLAAVTLPALRDVLSAFEELVCL